MLKNKYMDFYGANLRIAMEHLNLRLAAAASRHAPLFILQDSERAQRTNLDRSVCLRALAGHRFFNACLNKTLLFERRPARPARPSSTAGGLD